jgi:hypothetical protein
VSLLFAIGLTLIAVQFQGMIVVMTRITVNDALFGQLGAGREEAELCDSSGRRLGYFLPDQVYRELVCRWANAQVSNEELERCRQETESYSTAEVLDRLRSI